jgi:hypothetical protein
MSKIVKAPDAKKTDAGADIKRFVEQIKGEQEMIHRTEGSAIASKARIGVLLNELQAAAGRTWTKTARELGYHPRAASRLQMLGSSWLAQIGTNGSEILNRLPADEQKLEWLCRLSEAQLRQLLEAGDWKKASRPQVIAAVKKSLGEEAEQAKPASADVTKALGRIMKQLLKLIERAQTEEEQRCIQEALASVLQQVQQASAGKAEPTAPIAPEANVNNECPECVGVN